MLVRKSIMIDDGWWWWWGGKGKEGEGEMKLAHEWLVGWLGRWMIWD